MSECVQDIQLPGPTTKIVVFRDVVFKLKYKLSEHSLPDATVTSSVQSDLKRITSAVLDHLLTSQVLTPLKTDYMVVYPGLMSWSLVKANKLLFFHNSRNLRAYPQVVYLLVHMFAPPTATPTVAADPIGSGIKRPHPDDEQLPVCTGVLSSECITRKKLRLETEPPDAQIPSTLSDPNLPTEHAQTRPSPGMISKVAMAMRSEFELLRKPISPGTNNSAEATKKELSILGTIVRSVKGLFGWT